MAAPVDTIGRMSEPARMIPLGYGTFVRADRVFAVVPIRDEARGEGRRTHVHVEGLAEPLVASRGERAIVADIDAAHAELAAAERTRARRSRVLDDQDPLF